MSDLDKKLEEICESFYSGMPASHRQGALQAIKQAFIDEGWQKLRNHEEGEKCYTGQEWCNRFYVELSKLGEDSVENQGGWVTHSLVDEAAKKASGLSE